MIANLTIRGNSLGHILTGYVENSILTATTYDSMGNLIDLQIVTNDERIKEVDERDC